MRKCLTEFIGTFGLVFTIGCVALTGNGLGPLAIGAVLMALVYAGEHISGAHYNPAVTLSMLLRGKITLSDAVPYWIVQLFAALVAAWLARFVINPNPNSIHVNSLPGIHAPIAALLAEFFFTFAWVYVVLNVATSKDHPGNGFYGLAIGFTVAAGTAAVGGVSGAAFNPAVALGGMLMGTLGWSNFWVYLIAELAAAVIAALAFRYLNPDEGAPHFGLLSRMPKLSVTLPTSARQAPAPAPAETSAPVPATAEARLATGTTADDASLWATASEPVTRPIPAAAPPPAAPRPAAEPPADETTIIEWIPDAG